MYFLDRMRDQNGAEIYKTKNGFSYPLQKDRTGHYKIQSGEQIRVCMTSDFFLEEADPWRAEAWDIMRQRSDVVFFLLTKRPQPNLVKAYKDYKDKGFDIVGISLDSKADAWAKGVKDLNITWTQLSDLKGWQNSGAALYGVNSIPHTVLVDKDGTIIAKNLHGQELEDKIKEVLK